MSPQPQTVKAYVVSKTNRKASVVGIRAEDSSVAERTGLACENFDSILSTLNKIQSQKRMLNDQVSNYCNLVSRLLTTVIGLPLLSPSVNEL